MDGELGALAARERSEYAAGVTSLSVHCSDWLGNSNMYVLNYLECIFDGH